MVVTAQALDGEGRSRERRVRAAGRACSHAYLTGGDTAQQQAMRQRAYHRPPSAPRSPSRHDERQPDDDQGHTDTRDKPMHEEWRVGDAVKEVTGGHDEVA